MSDKRLTKSGRRKQAAPEPESIHEDLGRRVKKLRADRGWSLEELSLASGVSRSMLSEIERGRANPTLGVAHRIASAFGLSLQDLIESADSASNIRTIRAHDRTQLYSADKRCTLRTLSPLNLEKDVEFYELRLAPAGVLRSQRHLDGTREFLTVGEGSVELESGNSRETLGKGDSATYRADLPHAIINSCENEAVVFMVVIYR